MGPHLPQHPINRSPFSPPSNYPMGAGFSLPHPNSSLLLGGGICGNSLQANSLGALGRLRREVAKVPRPSALVYAATELGGVEEASFWEAAKDLMIGHAGRKQELEVGFLDEEGTGLGPTMEFYALLSAELR